MRVLDMTYSKFQDIRKPLIDREWLEENRILIPCKERVIGPISPPAEHGRNGQIGRGETKARFGEGSKTSLNSEGFPLTICGVNSSWLLTSYIGNEFFYTSKYYIVIVVPASRQSYVRNTKNTNSLARCLFNCDSDLNEYLTLVTIHLNLHLTHRQRAAMTANPMAQ
ncbi:uncharacterized protein CLUP02_11450 [Colletotrichum lupini]|uniref:Uncharacterized protein n=1 Tax=Colletotrichum lupini TaxID=145971 RepID=A0A9Q8SYM0_9PEZI|nr:uncharacterized protein CLUP02_11450 [Colletotrichum lupini]UQC85951.1 hypothetical protein CLUP02_11450 [Colletotrichum lupini]